MADNTHIHVATFAKSEDVVKVNDIIDQVIHRGCDEILYEVDQENLTVVLDQYQEQPHLLDPYLGDFLLKLITYIKDEQTPIRVVHQSFKYLYLFNKVRGYKHMVHLFPHEVADIQFILKLLRVQLLTEHKFWETRYVLLLWLAFCCIIPFDLSKLDGYASDENTLINCIWKTTLPYLTVADKCKDAASFLMARFLSRPDVKHVKLHEYFDWSTKVLQEVASENINASSGILMSLVLTFKHGNRENLLPHAYDTLSALTSINALQCENTLIRKLAVKLIQRIGLVYLIPRIASWRYTRGNRTLALNVNNQVFAKSAEDENTDDDEDFDIAEDVEVVLENLLTALKDKDTVVRWSAAKGIGRITGRLPKELADEVVVSLLEMFSFSELDCSWHGACLTLAELGRRGLLLPSRLEEVVPIILKALIYDERRGSFSVGSHVRDAACYICWSFARAYDAEQMNKFSLEIARSLLLVALFDREINCRRAASAAFQEHVGRQGSFPDGIEILTLADYFAVGNISNCYTNLSISIAKFPNYTRSVIDHLYQLKLSHWDSEIRKLASLSLHNLTELAPEYMLKTVLPSLASKMFSIDICEKHGAILSLAEIIHALYLHGKLSGANTDIILPEDLLGPIKELVPKMSKSNQFRGFGGELMRCAVCKLIEKISLSKIAIDDQNVLEDWLYIIEDTLPHTEESVQDAAICTLTPFASHYIQNSTIFNAVDIVDKYCNKLKATIKFERMGFARSLGALPLSLLWDQLEVVLSHLIDGCKIDAKKVNAGLYAESRQLCILSLLSIFKTNGLHNKKLVLQIDNVYRCFLAAMDDYTMDSRGDVGAWVREAGMQALVGLTELIIDTNQEFLNPETCFQIMCCLVQQLSEKIDRTRACAGNLLVKFLHMSPASLTIPHLKEITDLLPSSMIDNFNWSAPTDSYKAVSKLLKFKEYQYYILLGLTISVGGLTESIVHHSSRSLLDYLNLQQDSDYEMDAITDNLLKIMENFKSNNRVIIPMLRMLDLILSSGCLQIYDKAEKCDTFPSKLLLLVKDEMKRCADARKILSCVNVFCGLAQFVGDVRKKSLQQLMVLLCHKYPRVRIVTSEQLYTVMLSYDIVADDDLMDNITKKLADTSWNEPVQNLRPIRNELCVLLDVPIPKLKNTSSFQEPSSHNQTDDLDSYKALVSRSGF